MALRESRQVFFWFQPISESKSSSAVISQARWFILRKQISNLSGYLVGRSERAHGFLHNKTGQQSSFTDRLLCYVQIIRLACFLVIVLLIVIVFYRFSHRVRRLSVLLRLWPVLWPGVLWIGLITVFDTILMGRQGGEKLQCFYVNPIANNFFQN